MNPTTGKNERQKLEETVKFQRRQIFGQLGALFATIAGWGWTVVNQRVVLVPPEIRRPYEIGPNYGDKEYLSDVTEYVLQQILTVTPDSVDNNVKVILKMTDPDGYGELKATLEAAADRIKKEKITTVWSPRKEAISPQGLSVRMRGPMKTYIADTLTSTVDKEYRVDFTITSSGRLYVLNAKEIVKTDPAARRAG